MTRAAFLPRDGALVPLDDDGRAAVAALKPGRAVLVTIRAPRNVRHHRLLFRLLSMVIDGGAWEGNRDSLLDYVKVESHHVRTVISRRYGVVYIPKSIAFEAMAQDEFRAWFDRAVYVICHRLLDREDWEAVRDEIVAAVDGLPPRDNFAASQRHATHRDAAQRNATQ